MVNIGSTTSALSTLNVNSAIDIFGTITPDQVVNIESTTTALNINGGMIMNAIGGTTTASNVKFEQYGKIINFNASSGSPTVPSNTSYVLPITGFTSLDYPHLYSFVSMYNSGTYNCNVIANMNAGCTAMSIYVNNINTTAVTCQIFWNLKYIV